MVREHNQVQSNQQNYDETSNKRRWREHFIDHHRVRNHFSIDITTSTRTELPTTGVPEKLYSSLKYDQVHTVNGNLLKDFGFLVVKVHVVNPETGEEIKMMNRPILKGTTEASVAAQGDPLTLEAKLRWQFTGCSYHHQRKHFAFIASYYTPQDMDTPLIQLISAPFLVYARKPTPSDPMAKAKPRGIHTKRIREEAKKEESAEQPPAKVPKTEDTLWPTAQSNNNSKDQILSLFRSKVNELAQLRSQLTPEQQQEATDLIFNNLLFPYENQQPLSSNQLIPQPELLDMGALFPESDEGPSSFMPLESDKQSHHHQSIASSPESTDTALFFS